MPEPILIGYDEVSKLLGVPVNTLKDYHAKGKGGPRSAVIFGKVRYRRSDVLEWIDQQFEKPGKGGAVRRFTPLGSRSLVSA